MGAPGRPAEPGLAGSGDCGNYVGFLGRREGSMATKSKRVNIKLKSSESPHIYYTSKNKQKHPGRLELNKYDPVVRKHVLYKESR
jgi:large subunit ribosomal protein L33